MSSSFRPLVLRVLTPEDWQSFRRLRREALRDAPDAFGSTFAEWSADDVRETNAYALALYRRKGFVDQGRSERDTAEAPQRRMILVLSARATRH